MLAILDITLPIFLLIGAGYGAVRFNILDGSHINGLARFVVRIAFPAMIFHALAELSLSEFIISEYLIAFGAATIVLYTAAFLLAVKYFRQDRVSAALNGMGSAYGNSGYIGFPILGLIMGPKAAAVYLGMHLLIESFFAIMPTLVLLQSRSGKASVFSIFFHAAEELLKTPLILSLILGLLCSVLGLHVPQVLNRFFEMLSISAAPVATFVIGGSLYGVQIRSNIKEASMVSLGKLICMPVLVMAILACFPNVPDESRTAALIMACTPSPTIFSVLGRQYGRGERTASTLVICTLLSFFSLTIALMISVKFFHLVY